jgi:hypothetical protein
VALLRAVGDVKGDGLSISSIFLVFYVVDDDLADIGVLALLDEGGIAETLVVDIILPPR